MNVRVSRRASRQVEVIHRYLREQRLSTAEAFLDAFFELRSRIDAYPRSTPVIEGTDLQASLSKFPYVVVYRVTTRGVIILGVFHTSRHPSARTRP